MTPSVLWNEGRGHAFRRSQSMVIPMPYIPESVVAAWIDEIAKLGEEISAREARREVLLALVKSVNGDDEGKLDSRAEVNGSAGRVTLRNTISRILRKEGLDLPTADIKTRLSGYGYTQPVGYNYLYTSVSNTRRQLKELAGSKPKVMQAVGTSTLVGRRINDEGSHNPSLTTAVCEVLGQAKKPLTASEIRERLPSVGYTKVPTPNHLHTALRRAIERNSARRTNNRYTSTTVNGSSH